MLSYSNADPQCHHCYVLPAVLELLKTTRGKRIFDIGCGNGAADQVLHEHGFEVMAVDISETGIALARQTYPNVQFEVANCYDDLASRFNKFSVVISLEVIEHLYDPRTFIRRSRDLLVPGGQLILSTPYNGYLKNIMLAVPNQLDNHLDPLWDHGHIKFWSIATLTRLLTEEGFSRMTFRRVGRIAPLAKSMVISAFNRS